MWSRGLALVNFVSLLLITPVVVFYLIVDWHPMLARLDEALPRDYAPTIRGLAVAINDALRPTTPKRCHKGVRSCAMFANLPDFRVAVLTRSPDEGSSSSMAGKHSRGLLPTAFSE